MIKKVEEQEDHVEECGKSEENWERMLKSFREELKKFSLTLKIKKLWDVTRLKRERGREFLKSLMKEI